MIQRMGDLQPLVMWETLQNALGQNRGGWGGEQTGAESPAAPFTSCPDWPGGSLRKILPFRSAGWEETH